MQQPREAFFSGSGATCGQGRVEPPTFRFSGLGTRVRHAMPTSVGSADMIARRRQCSSVSSTHANSGLRELLCEADEQFVDLDAGRVA